MKKTIRTAFLEFYRELYRGHEIANHCNYHPYPFLDGVSYELAEEPFDPETADKGKIYRSEKPALYHVTNRLGAWRLAAKTEDYLRFVREGREGLERIFGAGSVQGFAWPYGRQANAEIEKYLCNA